MDPLKANSREGMILRSMRERTQAGRVVSHLVQPVSHFILRHDV